LINKGTKQCIVRDKNGQGANLSLTTEDQINFNDLAVWRDELTWGGINSLADWEQKINIPGNGPYKDGQRLVTWGYSGGAPNESWYAVPEQAKVELANVSFNVDLSKILELPPITAHLQTIENNSDDVQSPNPVVYTWEEDDVMTFKDESGFSFTAGVEISGGIPDIGEAKTSISVQTSFKFSTEKSTTIKKILTASFNPVVPAHSKINCSAVVLKGQLDVPYTAQIKRTYPNGVVKQDSYSGTFTRVSAFSVVTKFEKV